MVRDYASEAERSNFQKYFPEHDGIPPYGLNLTEAECWVNLVWLSGGQSLLGEKLRELSSERKHLLELAYPPNTHPVRWVDWYENPEVVLFRSYQGPELVAAFNLSDEPVQLTLPASKLGLPAQWTFQERITKERFGGSGNHITFPIVHPHAGKVWLLEK